MRLISAVSGVQVPASPPQMIISCNPNGLQLFHFGRVRMGCVFIKCIYGLPIAAWNEMSIDVNGHLDAGMTQLFLDVNRTFTI
jgi:hypothetical protein